MVLWASPEWAFPTLRPVAEEAVQPFVGPSPASWVSPLRYPKPQGAGQGGGALLML